MEKKELKKIFRYIPGDNFAKEDLVLDEDNWAEHLKEPFLIEEVTIENNLDLVYSALDDNGNSFLLCEADFKEELK